MSKLSKYKGKMVLIDDVAIPFTVDDQLEFMEASSLAEKNFKQGTDKMLLVIRRMVQSVDPTATPAEVEAFLNEKFVEVMEKMADIMDPEGKARKRFQKGNQSG